MCQRPSHARETRGRVPRAKLLAPRAPQRLPSRAPLTLRLARAGRAPSTVPVGECFIFIFAYRIMCSRAFFFLPFLFFLFFSSFFSFFFLFFFGNKAASTGTSSSAINAGIGVAVTLVLIVLLFIAAIYFGIMPERYSRRIMSVFGQVGSEVSCRIVSFPHIDLLLSAVPDAGEREADGAAVQRAGAGQRAGRPGCHAA